MKKTYTLVFNKKSKSHNSRKKNRRQYYRRLYIDMYEISLLNLYFNQFPAFFIFYDYDVNTFCQAIYINTMEI